MRLTEMVSRFYKGEWRSSKKFDKNREYQQGQSAIAKEMKTRVIQSSSKQMNEGRRKARRGKREQASEPRIVLVSTSN